MDNLNNNNNFESEDETKSGEEPRLEHIPSVRFSNRPEILGEEGRGNLEKDDESAKSLSSQDKTPQFFDSDESLQTGENSRDNVSNEAKEQDKTITSSKPVESSLPSNSSLVAEVTAFFDQDTPQKNQNLHDQNFKSHPRNHRHSKPQTPPSKVNSNHLTPSIHQNNSLVVPDTYSNGDPTKTSPSVSQDLPRHSVLSSNRTTLGSAGPENSKCRQSKSVGIVNEAFVDDEAKKPDHKQEKKRTSDWITRQMSSIRQDIVRQSFSEQQKKTMRSYSSANYTPVHSIAYIKWMKIYKQGIIARLEIDRWFLVFLIGTIVGLLATFSRQLIIAINANIWKQTRSYVKEGYPGTAFAFQVCINYLLVVVAAIAVTIIHPIAAGGGAPEVIAFLNGITMRGVLTFKNLVVKFFANVFDVASGLPTAIQGPLITFGAIIGASIGQFQSKPFHFSPKIFSRFRNAEDRRCFTTDGVAAGVSAGFNAPIGGLLFAMEDLSSHWSKGLSWQTFFCAVVATAVAQSFNEAFSGFHFKGSFGQLTLSVSYPISMSLLTIVPAFFLGIIGGLLGVVFTQVNVFIGMKRKKMLGRVKWPKLQTVIKIAEPCLIVTLMTAFTVFLPMAFPCIPKEDTSKGGSNVADKVNYIPYSNCINQGNFSYFSDVATLVQNGGTGFLNALWSRNTYNYYTYKSCLPAFAIYFPLTLWTAGTAVSGGIFVPLLVSGSLLGRTLGYGFVQLWHATSNTTAVSEKYAWIDPGIMAALGAAGMLSGVNRLEVASTVILVEMVGDINLVIPILLCIFTSISIANQLSKPLYKYQLDSKALPWLDSEPVIVLNGKQTNTELWTVKDIMTSPVRTIECIENVVQLAEMLLNHSHSSFPVVKTDFLSRNKVAHGLMTRTDLYVLLCSDEVYEQFHECESSDYVISTNISYDQMASDHVNNIERIRERMMSYTLKTNSTTKIDIEKYIDMSVAKIDENYSLFRAYRLFRTMGLRHLLVIDKNNKVVGMVTRKDLLQFQMQEKLKKLLGSEIVIAESNYSGNLNARRVSRRVSVDDGTILGLTTPYNNNNNNYNNNNNDEFVVMPAITLQMDTITEEREDE